MRDWAGKLVARDHAEGVGPTGDNGLLTGLVRQVLQTGLEVEMTDRLGDERHAVAGGGERRLAQRVDKQDRRRHARFSSATSSWERRSPAAATFCSRWESEPVPGIGSIAGDRASNHANTTCIAVA